MQRHEGYITRFFSDRGYGFIAEVEGSILRHYYLHASRITAGQPKVGASGMFSVLPVIEGKLPTAFDAEISEAVSR